MATCPNCDSDFDPASARAEFDDLVDDGQYDDELCLDCALPAEVQSNMNSGRAIDMVNGEEAYDDEFVEKHL